MEPIFSRLSASAASVADLPPLCFMAFMALEQRSVFRKRGNASKARLWSVRSASFSTVRRTLPDAALPFFRAVAQRRCVALVRCCWPMPSPTSAR